jgi:hypothetical protein
MPYENTRELKEDVLFRASEPGSSASQWNIPVVDYLNRVYRTLVAGASEFLPEYVEDWWWMRREGAFVLEPSYRTGTVAVVQNSDGITFSPAPGSSLAGRRLRVREHPDIFIIQTHTAGLAAATLDLPYTGRTGSFEFDAMKVMYELPEAVEEIISPIVFYRDRSNLFGLPPDRMDQLYPLRSLEPGTPEAFSLENTRTLRVSHGGRTDGYSMRVDYRYRPVVEILEDTEDSIPIVPLQWRHLLADMALVYVMLDKNDDRSNATALAARTGLAAMIKENRRKYNKMDQYAGHIFPRGGPVGDRNMRRTENGAMFDFSGR